MGTKCFRNNAKIQPMRRNFFLQLGTLEMHWELYWEPLCKCNLGHINRIFLHSLSSNASCGGCLSIYGGDRNQLCAMNLGAPCGHRRHTLDVKKTDTNTDKFLSLFSFFLSLYMHHQSYEWQFFLPNQRLPLSVGLKFSPQYMPVLQSSQWEASWLVTERFGELFVSLVMFPSVGFLVWIATIIPFIILVVVK